MNFPLNQFNNQFGTGILVTRQTTTQASNPEDVVAGGTKSDVQTIFEGIRYVESEQRTIRAKQILDEFGVQVGKVFYVHFFDTDGVTEGNSEGVQVGDIVNINPQNEKKKIAFDSSLSNSILHLRLPIIGFSNHKAFIAISDR